MQRARWGVRGVGETNRRKDCRTNVLRRKSSFPQFVSLFVSSLPPHPKAPLGPKAGTLVTLCPPMTPACYVLRDDRAVPTPRVWRGLRTSGLMLADFPSG